MPEAIAKSQILERFTDDATEYGTDHGTGRGSLGDAGSPQIDVIGRLVDGGKVLVRVVDESSVQVVPAASGFESAVLAEGVVRGDAVVSASLHVQSGQIQSPVLVRVLEQMIGHLL